MNKPEKKEKVGFFENLKDDSGGSGRVSKSIIEHDENGVITKIILRDNIWPNYQGWTYGTEWVISDDTIIITNSKKRGFESKTINISNLVELIVDKPGLGYTGLIVIGTKNVSSPSRKVDYSRFLYNQFDILVALEAGIYIRDRAQSDIKIEIDQVLFDFKVALELGNPETVALVKRRKMPHVIDASKAKPPIIKPTPDPTTRIEYLKSLKELLDSGVLTQEEFDTEKAKILNP
ncbi:MAG: SHOCT domain-containing protein [Defluviitaleaceae bacterium]|nr:SHOCT domain-containing protein [Defluviitaleaceae bacterium]